MSKVTIDASLCTGCGLCQTSCPEVFEVRDDGIAYIISQNSEGCDIESVAADCPVEAIKVQ